MGTLPKLHSHLDKEQKKAFYPSPVTPAHANKATGSSQKALSGKKEVEDARKSFENYLVEMIVEGKVRELMDVEEFLYCWNNLKSLVFIDLVSGFYGELCRDLYCPDDADGGTDTSD